MGGPAHWVGPPGKFIIESSLSAASMVRCTLVDGPDEGVMQLHAEAPSEIRIPVYEVHESRPEALLGQTVSVVTPHVSKTHRYVKAGPVSNGDCHYKFAGAAIGPPGNT